MTGHAPPACLLFALAALFAGPTPAAAPKALEGEVVDRRGQPVAGAKVSRCDDRQRALATIDAAGKFRLSSTFVPPGFLFVQKEGFRFHGQRCDKPDRLRIVLSRRDEPAARKLTT